MYAFLLLALPALVIWYCTGNSRYSVNSFIPPVLISVFIAVFLCLAKEFLFVSSVIVEQNYFTYTAKLIINLTVIPCALLALLFYFISRDSLTYKIHSFLPLEASFYAILLPFYVITGEEKISFFLNICLPVLIVSSLLFSQAMLYKSEKSPKEHKWGTFLIAALPMAVPSIIQGLWMFGMHPFFYSIISVAFACLSVILFRKNRPNQ